MANSFWAGQTPPTLLGHWSTCHLPRKHTGSSKWEGKREFFDDNNYSDPDTNGTEESVHISEVSLFQGLSILGERNVSHISELSLFQGLNCTQELFSGKKMSLLERCPRFRSVLRERFHCEIFISTIYKLSNSRGVSETQDHNQPAEFILLLWWL